MPRLLTSLRLGHCLNLFRIVGGSGMAVVVPSPSSVRDKENARRAHEGAMRVAERQGRIYENRQREYNRIADHVDRMWYAANTKETPCIESKP